MTMVKRTFLLCLFICSVFCSIAQKNSAAYPKNKKRLWITAGANAAFWTGSYIALNKVWYSEYPRSRFHFFNDNDEWNQMDKAGHAWTGYTLSLLSAKMWKWTGLNDKASALLGGATGFMYQGIIEMQDAYSAEWGFSWSDIGANALGSGLFVSQQLLWQEQRIQLKLGYIPYRYPDQNRSLLDRRNNLFGHSFAERILKDYNSQTYWASVRVAAFFPDSGIPKWLNVAVGYGSDGLYGARNNKWIDKNGNSSDFTSIERVKRFYLSPDIDLTKIPTGSKLLRSVFQVLNILKIPAPALELNSRGKLQGHAIRF